MFDRTYVVLTIATTGLCIAWAVWVFVSTKFGANQANPKQSDREADGVSERRDSQVLDWVNTALNILIGVFLGIAIGSLGRLQSIGFWSVAILVLILIAGLLLFDSLIERLFAKFFPSEIRPARKPQGRRRAPLPRYLSLLVGAVLGAALVLLGWEDKLLGMI